MAADARECVHVRARERLCCCDEALTCDRGSTREQARAPSARRRPRSRRNFFGLDCHREVVLCTFLGMTGFYGGTARSHQGIEVDLTSDTPHRTKYVTPPRICAKIPAWQETSQAQTPRPHANGVLSDWCLITRKRRRPRQSVLVSHSVTTWRCSSLRTSAATYRPTFATQRGSSRKTLASTRSSTVNSFRWGPNRAQTCEKRPVSLAAMGRPSTRYSASRRNFDLGPGPEGLVPTPTNRRDRTAPMLTQPVRAAIAPCALAWRDRALCGNSAVYSPSLEAGGARG